MTIRDAAANDFPAILELNAASVHFLSPLDAARLRHLHAQAAYHRVVELQGRVVAFLLAFREGAHYDSPNYLWFAQQYSAFLYIDRVVVDDAARGLGLGIQLYDDILAFAAHAGIARLTCEFDLDPPNPVSAKFHQRYAFREVGRQRVGAGMKQVSLQARDIEVRGADSGMIDSRIHGEQA
jgi:predicted GNAT superfamily acetyltransferase